MGRKVSVTLEADVAGFVRPVETAKVAVDDLGDKVEKLDKELDKIPADAAKAGAALRMLGGDVNAVGDKVTSLGEKNAGLAVLDQKIKETRTEVRKLSEEFVKTGDVDVFRKLNEASGRLANLQTVRKKLADAVLPEPQEIESWFKRVLTKAEGFGDSIAKVLPDAISGALATPVLGPIIAAALIAALVAAVSTVLATAGGLVLGGAGLGLVTGGIIGAILGDPKTVGDAWSKELASVKTEFIDATQPVRQPLLDAVHEFGIALRGINMAAIFGPAAQWLPQLVHGASEFVMWLGRAGEELSKNAGPEVKVIAEELPKVGQAIAVAASAIGEGSEGGAIALKNLFGMIEIVIAGLGGMIGQAEKVYAAIAKFSDLVIPRSWIFPEATPQVESFGRALHGAGDELKSFVPDLDKANQELNKTKVTMDSLEATIVDKIFQATMGLDQAFLGVAESLTRVSESIKKNGRELDIHKEKGQANREAILGAVQANMELYQAQVKAGMSAEDAAKAYGENTAALEAQLRKAGLTKDQIDGLIGKYRDIPSKVDSDIAINGLTHAINGLTDLIKLINGIHDKTVTVYYRTKGQSLNAPLAHGGIRRAAVGMVIPPSDPGTTLVGEPQTGGEALIPLRGIAPMRAAMLGQIAMAGYGYNVVPQGGGGGGMQTLRVIVQNPDGRVLRDEIVNWNANRGRTDPNTYFLP